MIKTFNQFIDCVIYVTEIKFRGSFINESN